MAGNGSVDGRRETENWWREWEDGEAFGGKCVVAKVVGGLVLQLQFVGYQS